MRCSCHGSCGDGSVVDIGGFEVGNFGGDGRWEMGEGVKQVADWEG